MSRARFRRSLALLCLLPLGATAATCSDSDCRFDHYDLNASGTIVHETVTDSGVDVSNYSAAGSFDIFPAGAPTAIMHLDGARMDLYSSFTCSDANCTQFDPTGNELFFVDSNGSGTGALHMALPSVGLYLQTSSLKADLSDAARLPFGLSGSIRLADGPDGPAFGMHGGLELALNRADGAYDALTIDAFTFSVDANSSFAAAASTCQNSDTFLSATLGNLMLASNTVCVNDDRSGLIFMQNSGATLYLKSRYSDENAPAIRYPAALGGITIDLRRPPSAINLNRQTITLGDSLSLNAAGLCLPTGDAATGESNITTGYAACGGYEPLTVGGLDLGPAVGTIDLMSMTLTEVTFENPKRIQTWLPDGAGRRTWYGTAMDDAFYFASDTLTHFSEEQNRTVTVAYGYLCDTAARDTASYYYRTRAGILIKADGLTAFAGDESAISVSQPAALMAMQPHYRIVHTDLNQSRFAVRTDLNGTGLSDLLISDHGNDFLTNYHAALEALGSIYYDLDGGGRLLLEARFARGVDIRSGEEYLYAQLPQRGIASLDIDTSDGSLSGPAAHITTQGYTLSADGMAYSPTGLPLLPASFTLQFAGATIVGVTLESGGVRLKLNDDETLFAAAVTLETNGSATIAPDAGAAIRFADGGETAVANRMTIDWSAQTVTIHPDTEGIITLGERTLYASDALTVSFDALQSAYFDGTVATGGRPDTGFHFTGTGTYDLKSLRFGAIAHVNAENLVDPRYDNFSNAFPVLYIDGRGIYSNAMGTPSFHEGNVSSVNGRLHFATYGADGQLIDFILHNASVSIDPDNAEIIGVSANKTCDPFDGCTVNPPPSVSYVNPAGTAYEISGSDLAFVVNADAPKLIRLKAPVTIQESGATAFDVDGDVDIDYVRRKIVRIRPKPGTGLILNEHIGIYSDGEISMQDNVLVVQGTVDIGPASLVNVCVQSADDCIRFSGTLRYDTVKHAFIDIVTDGTLQLPNPSDTTVSVTTLVSIDGEPYFRSEEAGLSVADANASAGAQGIVIDLNAKKLSAVKSDESYIWTQEGTYFVPQDGLLVAEGDIVISNDGSVPATRGGTAAAAPPGADDTLDAIIARARAQIGNDQKSIVVTDTKVTYGRYRISSDESAGFTVRFTDDGKGYLIVEKPHITVLEDENSDYGQVYDDAVPLLYYENNITVGKTDNTIASVPCIPEANTTKCPYYLKAEAIVRYPGNSQDMRLSSLAFTIASDENGLAFQKTDEIRYDDLLPDLNSPSLWMEIAGNGSAYLFTLYKDKVEVQSKFSYWGGDFFGIFEAGESANIFDLIARSLFIDLEADPTVTLSQNVGESEATQHYGVVNFIKTFKEFKSESEVSWATYIGSAQSTEDLVRVDLDFLTKTYGGSIQLPLQSLGSLFKAETLANAQNDVYLDMHWQEVDKGDGRTHVWLDQLGVAVKYEAPFMQVPAEPAGVAFDKLEADIDGIADIGNDDGTLDVNAKISGPILDGADVAAAFKNATGLDLLKVEGGFDMKVGKGQFQLTFFGEELLFNSYTLNAFDATVYAGKVSGFTFASVAWYGTYIRLDQDSEIVGDADAHTLTIGSSGEASVVIPSYVPIIGGKQLSGLKAYGDIKFHHSSCEKADVGMVYEYHISKHWRISFDMGCRLYPDFRFYADKQGTQGEAEPDLSLYLGDSAPIAVPETAGSSLQSALIAVPVERRAETVFIKVAGSAAAPAFSVTFPDGRTYDADVDDTLFFSSNAATKETYLALHRPEPGTYTLRLDNAAQSGSLRIERIEQPPEIEAELALASGSIADGQGLYNLTLTLAGVQEADVTLFATRERKLNLGRPVSGTYRLGEGTHTLSAVSEHAGLYSGDYYVYARIDAPGRVPRFAWLDGTLRYTHPASPETPYNLRAVEANDAFLLTWEQPDPERIARYVIRVYDENGSDLIQVHQYPADAGSFTVRGLEAGRAYAVRVEAVDKQEYTALSAPLPIAARSDTHAGSPDLTVDGTATRAAIDADGTLAVTVCNRGSADAQNARLDVYYKASLPQTRLDPFETGTVRAGECVAVALSIDPERLAYIRANYAETEEALFLHIEGSEPKEYATANNFAYITSPNINFPLTGTATLTLEPGWNLVALPLNKGALSLKAVHGIEKVWGYDAHTGWQDGIEALLPGRGYWIKVSETTALKVFGQPYAPDMENLNEGWHLLGTGTAIEEPSQIRGVENVWTRSGDGWMQNPQRIEPGSAFWVHIQR